MNRIVKALIISLVISSFLVPGGFFAIQKIQQSDNLKSLLKNKPLAPLYAVKATLQPDDARNGKESGTPDVLQKRLQSVCEHLALEKNSKGMYHLSADGIKDTLLLKKLLTAGSTLQWWELYNLGEYIPFLQRADSLLHLSTRKKDTLRPDSTPLNSVEQLLRKKASQEIPEPAYKDKHPFSFLMHVNLSIRGSIEDLYADKLGYVDIKDTPVVNGFLRNPVVKACMPADAAFLYGKPYLLGKDSFPFLNFYAVKRRDPRPILDESFLTSVSLQTGQHLNEDRVLFTFNKIGASRLERMTSNNLNRHIAMVANNEVITAPLVTGSISDGAMALSATGHDARLVYLLAKYRSLSAPMTIRQLNFSIQPAPSLFKGIWPLVWLLVFTLIFLLAILFDKATRNMTRQGRK